MKNLKTVILVVLLLVIAGLVYFAVTNSNKTEISNENSIVGCYVMRQDKDVYTMEIISHEEDSILGTLDFNNFQKDSSSGELKGSYFDGILIASYTFTSEGSDSELQVAFKKSGTDFIRGFGPVDAESGTHFTSFEGIVYDATVPLSVFKKEACPENTQ